MTKVLALAGGVGGAKLVWGLSKILPYDDFSIIVNTGDDFVHYGLNISPDLDTVMYTLAGLSNETTGWGKKNETWNCHEELMRLNPDSWFMLGDHDLANHMERTNLLNSGKTLTEVTAILCNKYEVKNQIFPMTDETVSTIIQTREYGEISFQEYFVKHKFQPTFIDYRVDGLEGAKLNKITRKAIEDAEIIVICPSNPWLSIMPILEIEDMKSIISKKVCLAVSPIVGNSAIKGPAAKIFHEKGITPNAIEIARLYRGIIKGFVFDTQNRDEYDAINGWGIIPLVTDTIMTDGATKQRLAKDVMNFAYQLA